MADNTKADAGQSPDFLAPPGRGQGVRRLNRLPLLIVGGLGLLAILAITYTMLEREAAMKGVARAPVEAPSVGATATPPVKPSDALAPPTPPAQPVAPAAAPTKTAPTAPADEYKARMQLIQRIESKRVSAEMAALTASATVPGFEKPQEAASSTQGGTGQMTPAQLAGLQAAQAMMGQAGAGNGRQGGAAGATRPIVPALNVAAGLGGYGPGLAGGGAGGDQNRQDEKRAFLAQRDTDTSTYLKHTRTPPLSDTEIKAGTVIPGVLISGVNSDLPGQIIAQVRRNVYDTATGRHLLIPAGARLIGTYDSSVAMGQSRVLVGWKRIIYPDGSSVSLDFMPGTDQSGYAGLHDQVNNHLWQIFGNALLLSAFSAGVQLSQPQATNGQNYNSSQIVAGALGMQLGELGMQLAQRGMNIQPTLQIRPGFEFNIMVTKDIILPVWKGPTSSAP
jgi:type IV secretion system protein VirB10